MGKPLTGKKRTVVLLAIWVSTIAVIILVRSMSISGAVFAAAKKAKLTNEFIQLQTAVLSYNTEYSVYPAASDNAALIKMLDGSSASGNTRRIAFINLRPTDQNAKGDLLDPWGTPIELSVAADGKLHVRSAGPDKTFGTPDDISGDTDLAGAK